MNASTKKWLFLKYSSAILLPLMFWFIINLSSIYDESYLEIMNFFSLNTTRLLFSLFLLFAYFFSSITISEIFEDYIYDEKIKNVANKTVYIFAIMIPLITIISIFNLTI
jgi:succinate dehydrogenase / fumarate reductase membrane anchor subunit